MQINRRSDLSHTERRQQFGVASDRNGSVISTSKDHVRVKRWLNFGRKETKSPQIEFKVDWRNATQPKCLNEPEIDQGDCGCCYAMAMVKLFEWKHCIQTQKPIKFSEQFLIDCGRVSGLNGCINGNALSSFNFIKKFGLMEAQSMPFIGLEQKCPIEQIEDDDLDTSEIGSIKTKSIGYQLLMDQQRQWPVELAKQPLIVYMRLSDDFFDYGGGLFEVRDCDPELGHFMLLVGQGQERQAGQKELGRPFWLLSNSFGLDYGESGYIRVASDQKANNCLVYAINSQIEY